MSSSFFNLENATSYHYGQFPPNSLDLGRLVHQLLKAAEAIARFDQILTTLHNSEILLAPLRNQEAVISSRMEGTVSTMDEILQYEADYGNSLVEGYDIRQDVIETLLYQRTLKNAQKALEDGYQISKSLIKTMHEQLLSYGRGSQKSPGQFKHEQNYLADRYKKSILFIPISPERLEEGLDFLFDYIHNHKDPVLLKTAVSHLEFEALHPFQDGNGRIGRMLITLMLWQNGVISAPHFYISGYFETHKDEYIDLMREVSITHDWNAWCEFFLKAIEYQSIHNLTIAENIRDLYEEMKGIFNEVLATRWSIQALDFIFTNPVFLNSSFVDYMVTNTDISEATASRYSKKLHERNLLKITRDNSGNKSTMYSFEPLMTLVRI